MFMLIYGLNERQRLAENTLKAWNFWVRGEGRAEETTIRSTIVMELKREWSMEVAEAFVEDLFEARFSEHADRVPRNTTSFLKEVASETKARPPTQMSQYLLLLQWLDETERYPWYHYLKACSIVPQLRRFIETQLTWYLELVDFSLSNTEFSSLLDVVKLVGEGNWQNVLKVRDYGERKKLISHYGEQERQARQRLLEQQWKRAQEEALCEDIIKKEVVALKVSSSWLQLP